MDFDIGHDFSLGFPDDLTGNGMSLDFATGLDSNDVLDNFDFDSLLNSDANMQFDA